MNGSQSCTALAVVALVVAATLGGVLLAGGGSPVAVAVGQTGDDADRGAGAEVETVVAAQSADLGTPVAAPDGPFDRAFYGRVSALAAAYNDRRPDLGLGGRFATGNVVTLRVTDGGDAAAVSFRLTEDNRIEDLRAGARGDAKIRLTTDRATFDRVATAASPGDALRRAVAAGDVRVRGRGVGSGVVWAVVNRLLGL